VRLGADNFLKVRLGADNFLKVGLDAADSLLAPSFTAVPGGDHVGPRPRLISEELAYGSVRDGSYRLGPPWARQMNI
jgi:hypothetical protein